jgi:ribose 5-phosphate isomerase A
MASSRVAILDADGLIARRDPRRRGIITSMSVEHEKRLAAEAAAELVQDRMTVGLGTGSTVAYLLPALAVRGLDIRCVATSPATEHLANELGIVVVSFRGPGAPARLDIAIDGADQVARSGWLVKGGGGAHTREKAVAAAADRFVVIVSSEKLVENLRPPVPLELLEFGLAATLARLQTVLLRDAPSSPEGGVIADFTGEFDDPARLAARLSGTVGVLEHGLFEPELVSAVIVGRAGDVEHIDSFTGPLPG